ncbi:shikimate dehydrogenase [Pseudonocardia sp. WMMC193]|uniref:shikimate dehydrogenase n=1 Tax=Pseudonocardia sp. WMMC193 TaxID=2911965 RepID=UPI001F1E8564|nr:shikimate dehydrogenase [Pseudonocardia sp. WMMC193]MCF7549437.1 shikimate dehydrogenase [Pseudonocardia sp. WMMC193]
MNVVRTGLIGSGIGPSLSPALHEREARELGFALDYPRFDLDVLGVEADAVGELLARARAAGHRGVNVTHPCKQRVIPHLDALSPDAAAIGAVNTVVFEDGRAVGYNTDWSGFRDGLVDGLPGAPLDRVVLLGAGGAGAAAAHALVALDVGALTVLDVDAERAAELAAALNARSAELAGTDSGTRVDEPGDSRVVGAGVGELGRALDGADGLVHATPVGMADHPGLPLPAALLRPELWVAEIVYRPLDTALLRAARAAGCRTLDGGRMAVHQAATAFRLFTGREPDPARMLRHLAELIGQEESRVA